MSKRERRDILGKPEDDDVEDEVEEALFPPPTIPTPPVGGARGGWERVRTPPPPANAPPPWPLGSFIMLDPVGKNTLIRNLTNTTPEQLWN